MLCSYYYAEMERQFLSAHAQDTRDALLMRQVDDFLYVTPHVEMARSFAETLLAGTVCSSHPLSSVTAYIS